MSVTDPDKKNCIKQHQKFHIIYLLIYAKCFLSLQCYYVTGEADFILIVLAKDMQDFDEFTQSFFQ
ncbi:Lrp/AsnC ligand binding domain-containing protein [Colwellia marinimaniae]|uniref:Lrp/AsnC ligand binding domain-containing protein n=1 Tax=Colwellia marinimaniae TaxID=1513592 RepID=UPI0011809EE6